MKLVITDGGALDAGFKGTARDCAIRAIAIATEQPYMAVHGALSCTNQRRRGKSKGCNPRDGVFTDTAAFKRYMIGLGWVWVSTMGIGTGCTVHLRASELPTGRLVVKVSHHIVAVIDGELHDTYDCSRDGNRCVYGYWRKP